MAKIKINMKSRKVQLSLLAVILIAVVVVIAVLLLKKNTANTPIDMTKAYMDRFKNLDSEVVSKISYPYSDNLSDSQKKKYEEIIKSQYLSLNYEIVDENIGEIDAIVRVQFSVLDYASSYDRATSYLSLYEKDKSEKEVIDYKISEMENTKEKIEYTIEFAYYNLDGEWHMSDLSPADLRKIAGTF